VPEEYAAKLDAKQPSLYGQNQVATGPYMIENTPAGKAIGYEAGRRIHLVRNPNWDKTTDYKPAYLDEIDMPQGNDDTTIASRRVVDNTGMLTGDFSPPPQVLAQVVRDNAKKDQLALFPGGSARYVSMNTTVKPFDDINVRKAVIAGFDREAMRLVRGGELVGDIPTHLLPPGLPGFEEAGGLKGPGLDFMSHPGGDMHLAAEYFKKAGYASGRYEGGKQLLMVGTSEGVAEKAAEVAKENFEKLGFKVRLQLVTQDAMYTRFCNSPPANVAICPNVSWGKDFADAQTILDPTFNGKNIVQENNSNWPELNDPEINAAMAKAELLTDPAERAEAWAKIDLMVTEQAPLVAWIWDKQALIRSADVNGAVSEFNSMWDLSWTSLK
jgi:peptide/nickel transport system substrate-binding protein